MQLLKQEITLKGQSSHFTLYEEKHEKWVLKKDYKIEGPKTFYTFLKQTPFEIDYAILQINQPYRNLLYSFYPQLKMSLAKEAVIDEFEKRIGVTRYFYEEVAASLQRSVRTEKRDWKGFIYEFYSLSNGEEALALYEIWQLSLPLKDKYATSFIRFMEYYLQEIVNYFEIKGSLP